MRNLSARQQQVVQAIKDGCTLIRHFDVHGGYWWTLSPIHEKVLRATVDGLISAGVIVAGENVRIYSGYHEMPYTLRASLRASDTAGVR